MQKHLLLKLRCRAHYSAFYTGSQLSVEIYSYLLSRDSKAHRCLNMSSAEWKVVVINSWGFFFIFSELLRWIAFLDNESLQFKTGWGPIEGHWKVIISFVESKWQLTGLHRWCCHPCLTRWFMLMLHHAALSTCLSRDAELKHAEVTASSSWTVKSPMWYKLTRHIVQKPM